MRLFVSAALFYQSTLLARPLVVPHKHQEQPYMLTAHIHASQALQGWSRVYSGKANLLSFQLKKPNLKPICGEAVEHNSTT